MDSNERLAGSVAAIAAAINAMALTKTRSLEALGGQRVVVAILIRAANKLLEIEKKEVEDAAARANVDR